MRVMQRTVEPHGASPYRRQHRDRFAEDEAMTNEYDPEQKSTSTGHVVVAWLVAAAVIVAVALFAPQTSVDLEASSRDFTSVIRS
jgi:hypothetical protein